MVRILELGLFGRKQLLEILHLVMTVMVATGVIEKFKETLKY